ncbi:MAG: hypothetical protein MJK04_11300, partial [Psychrosphaera sp.]|nr:hypothetical protein [Psychrosphaera sp.]
FEIENLRIEFNDEQQFLEPKEALILRYVLENQVGGLINAETILNENWGHWNDKKVLQKVLSTLRRKFKAIGVTENGFVAADANYKINYVGVLVNDVQQALEKKQQTRKKLLRYAKAVVPSLFIAVVAFMFFGLINQGPQFSVSNIIQATAIAGASVEPDLSPDGSAMAFSHKKDGSSQIYLKIDSNLGFEILTEGHYDQVPAWSPTGRQLAFQRKDPNLCQIRLITLDDDLKKIGDDQLLTECNPHTKVMSMAFKDENTLFFTESQSVLGHNEIKQLDLISKKVTPYFSNKKSAIGAISHDSGQYFIVYSNALGALFSLHSPDGKVSNINRVNEDNTLTFLRQVGTKLLSFDIFEDQIIFKDTDNQLKSFDWADPQTLTTIYKNPLKAISYPVVSANSNKIAIVSGSIYKNSIHSMNLLSREMKEIMTSENLLKYPKSALNEILFVSDETGISQIYAFSDGVKTQITNFIKNRNIMYFSQSRDKKWLAISFSDSTIVYQRLEAGLSAVKTLPGNTYPDFSKNSERILVSNQVAKGKGPLKSMETMLVEYYLDGFKETGITIRDALYGIYHDSGIIFPTADHSIKLFKLNGIETIVTGFTVSSRSALAVNDTALFISDDVAPVAKIDLETHAIVEFDEPIHGEIAVNNNLLYYKKIHSTSLVIFMGELTSK